MSEIALDCPFCGKAKHLWVNSGTGLWICFRCGEAGNRRQLEERSGQYVPGELIEDQSPRSVSRPPSNIRPVGHTVRKWITQERGINPVLLGQLPIYEVPGGILFMFPHKEHWQVRQFARTPRWYGPTETGPSTGITYYVPPLQPTEKSEVVIVEGIFDALKVASAGFPAAAILGKRFHPEQARQLTERLYREAALMLDADVTLRDEHQVFEIAGQWFDRWRNIPLPRRTGSWFSVKDPGDMTLNEIRLALKESHFWVRTDHRPPHRRRNNPPTRDRGSEGDTT